MFSPMSEPESNPDLPDSLQEFAKGGSIPPVDSEDLKRVWQVYQEAQAQVKGNVGISVEILKAACSQGANVPAVVNRNWMLSMLEMTGQLLAPWRHGDELDVVFRVAATFPMEGMKRGVVYSGLPLDTDAFVDRLRSEGSGS